MSLRTFTIYAKDIDLDFNIQNTDPNDYRWFRIYEYTVFRDPTTLQPKMLLKGRDINGTHVGDTKPSVCVVPIGRFERITVQSTRDISHLSSGPKAAELVANGEYKTDPTGDDRSLYENDVYYAPVDETFDRRLRKRALGHTPIPYDPNDPNISSYEADTETIDPSQTVVIYRSEQPYKHIKGLPTVELEPTNEINEEEE